MTPAALPTPAGLSELATGIPTALGELGAIISTPLGAVSPLPGLVLVDGSGDGDRHSWGELPGWLAEAGAVTLRHDKPGCGGSPGHWTEQTFEDRARETLAALRVLREHPATAGQPIGLYGVSQGGWVALLAAALEPQSVDFVVCDSGPGTTPVAQERERLEVALRAEEHDEQTVEHAMGWVEERFVRIRRGDSVEAVLAEQTRYAGEPWYDAVLFPYDTPENLRFLRGIIDFDPTVVMRGIRCPVLALFGGADALVPVPASVAAFAVNLPRDPHHGLAVFPGADHGLFVAERRPEVPRREQLAPNYLPTVAAFLADRVAERSHV